MGLIVSDNSSRVLFFDGRNVTNVTNVSVVPAARCTCKEGSRSTHSAGATIAAIAVPSGIAVTFIGGIVIAMIIASRKRMKKVEINR